MEQNFDIQAYRAGSEVYCDSCGKVIDMNGATYSRIIAKDEEGCNVAEQFFDCPNCGAHYTIAVIDGKMQQLIQQRQQIRKKIALFKGMRKQDGVLWRLQKTDNQIKRQQETRMKMLKKKYEKECRQ